jgi:hypothetical protein
MTVEELIDKWAFRIGRVLGLWGEGSNLKEIEKNANFIMLKNYLSLFGDDYIWEFSKDSPNVR